VDTKEFVNVLKEKKSEQLIWAVVPLRFLYILFICLYYFCASLMGLLWCTGNLLKILLIWSLKVRVLGESLYIYMCFWIPTQWNLSLFLNIK
jgi:hypothetical protein